MKKNTIAFFLCSFFWVTVSSQTIDRIEPPLWWSGMVNPKLQLLVHGDKISNLDVELENNKDVELLQIIKLQNPNYLAIDLHLGEHIKPHTFKINFKKNSAVIHTYTYELQKRNEGSAERQGFNQSDAIVLITPDRFANGDPTNDAVAGMKEQPNRGFKGGRHGGDLKGMWDNLGYLKDMGYTALWLNPILENNMPEYSYHGYATTDYYQVDPRYGTNEQYQEFCNAAKEQGMGMIMDIIVNHIGTGHWWMDDLPSSDWLNFQDDYLKGVFRGTNHAKPTIQDPYVADIDLQEFVDGWFVGSMPDLNQRNPVLATYLIQNTIWWIEYANLAGIRMDTYPYPDKDFMTDWTCQIMAEYPNFNIVGEEWNGNQAIVAFWQQGKENPNGYTSCLPSLMDFPLQENVAQDLANNLGWMPTYRTIALDFVYADPTNLVIFPDNHDMSRFFIQINEDLELFKLGMAFYLTMRGIPQIYYGTEILMSSPKQRDDGLIRADFPGGWSGDKVNAFTGEGLTAQQKEAQAFSKKLMNWRKNESTIHFGKLLHYRPQNGIYVYFRYDDQKRFMVVLNQNKQATSFDLSRFQQMLSGYSSGQDVISGNKVSLDGNLTVPARAPMILELSPK